MNLKTLSISIILASLPTSAVFAAALDRSGQSIQAFLQPGNYVEAGISVLDANVSGKLQEDWKPLPQYNGSRGLGGSEISDMADSYQFYNAALKVQMTDKLSFGLLYDQPFGADAEYSTEDKSYNTVPSYHSVNKDAGAFHRNGEGTKVDVNTQTLSFLLGYQPNENWNIYGGAVYQIVEGEVALRGSAYGPLGGGFCATICSPVRDIATNEAYNGYTAKIKQDSSVGWLAGISYQIPEIALKAALTYRSEIDHKMIVQEDNLGYATNTLVANQMEILKKENIQKIADSVGQTKITTPQSINLDFQTGIMANTVAFANVRWVEWSKFAINPYKFGQVANGLKAGGFDLVAYEKDQISANVGIGRKFTDKWAGSVMVGWDSGAGNLVSTLGPTEGYWSAGLGVQFSPTNNSFIQAGAKYFWLGDAKSQVASHYGSQEYAADFKDNHAVGYSLKIGHRF
ncbi:transporter [Acinetobacter sp. 194]|uniref:outer membrane protein transport protein n=1 Tax=Acinetobacter shaoyimingii TaxID=2715164 RepID=UPI00140C5EAC|nr:outer membrane protein transport protein [Acinetobacter shaoyimingii]NHB57678.1 transporter [Acinetobacter shaoyimingii]